MKRRGFIKTLATAVPLFSWDWLLASQINERSREWQADLVVAGGGLGGCAAALAALRAGLRVILTENTDWIGGQATSQAVPPDEHPWIETFGGTRSYRQYRESIRALYRDHYPLTAQARLNERLNPGGGWVSRLCHEPRVSLSVLQQMLAPYLSNRQLRVLLEHRPVSAETSGDAVRALTVQDLRENRLVTLSAPYIIDATELGDVLALAKIEHVTGAESRQATDEPHAPETANSQDQQAFTYCFAVDHIEGEDHTIEKPSEYDFWRAYQPQMQPPWQGPLFSWTMTD
ncbi:MAG TPA: FAD-dependent oxidoreductase, partial [Candidatus Paceibacterota bacterium]|nr:FAD-dependent oxidoreductase [Candidatus Paceibacterota bacterium]